MSQKEKVSEQMQGLMLAFEEAKNQKVAQFGDFLREQYKVENQIIFSSRE
jgi:hypothetical protein